MSYIACGRGSCDALSPSLPLSLSLSLSLSRAAEARASSKAQSALYKLVSCRMHIIIASNACSRAPPRAPSIAATAAAAQARETRTPSQYGTVMPACMSTDTRKPGKGHPPTPTQHTPSSRMTSKPKSSKQLLRCGTASCMLVEIWARYGQAWRRQVGCGGRWAV